LHVSFIYHFCRKNSIQIPALDYIGKQWHDLKVIDFIGSSQGSKWWKCQCVCGKIVKLPTKEITAAKQKSCGCWAKRHNRQHYLWNGYEEIHGKWWSNIKKSAKARYHIFDITIEHAWQLYINQNRKCALSGLSIGFATTTRDWQHGHTTASIDRIDNNLGYIEGNIHWVHKDINKMKQNLNLDRFIHLCALIAHNN
jgi:hypothetical protein